MGVKILFLADTHLGFDFPFKPRSQRRRRGADFFANFRTALEPALKGEVDLVVHGGDLLYRSKVPARLAHLAFEPLIEVAEHGVPVYLVPGNHERSQIPFPLLAAHPNIHIFLRPMTYILPVRDFRLALVGFPYIREGIRKKFPAVMEETGYRRERADAFILCMHHCLEGATVGTGGDKSYTFRYQDDVVRTADIPGDFAAVLSGHIHRFQVLKKDLQGCPIPVPVFYPGSVERTSFAEKNERKVFLMLEIETCGDRRGTLKRCTSHELRTRPMIQVQLHTEGMNASQLRARLNAALQELPPDAVVKINILGHVQADALKVLSAASLRALAPGMNFLWRCILPKPDQ